MLSTFLILSFLYSFLLVESDLIRRYSLVLALICIGLGGVNFLYFIDKSDGDSWALLLFSLHIGCIYRIASELFQKNKIN